MLITPPVAWALACDDWVSLYWECLEPEEQSLGIRYAEEIGWQTENGKLTKVGELAVEQIREDYAQANKDQEA